MTKLSFVRMIRLHTRPLSRQPIVSLSQSSCVSPVQRAAGQGGKGGGHGAEPYGHKKAWACGGQYSR